MSEQPWFKVWAQSVLGSVDLNDFTDHEERCWWRLLCVAAGQVERWHVTVGMASLARMCCSTPPETSAALARFERLGMVHSDGSGGWWITNWERYQETPEARRQRLKRERDKQCDESRDMSRPESRLESRQEEERLEVRGREEKRPEGSLAESQPPRRHRSQKSVGSFIEAGNEPLALPSSKGQSKPLALPKKTTPTEEWAAEMREKHPLRDFDETLQFHMNGNYYRTCADKCGFLEKKLEAAVEREAAQPQRGGTNGRSRRDAPRTAEHEEQLAWLREVSVRDDYQPTALERWRADGSLIE